MRTPWKKRSLSALLAAILLLGMLPAGAWATEGGVSDKASYQVTFTSSEGGTIANADPQEVLHGECATAGVTATPDGIYDLFQGWAYTTTLSNGTEKSGMTFDYTTFPIYGDTEFHAKFFINAGDPLVAVNMEGHGTVSSHNEKGEEISSISSSGTFPWSEMDTSTITANAAPGYRLSKITVNMMDMRFVEVLPNDNLLGKATILSARPECANPLFPPDLLYIAEVFQDGSIELYPNDMEGSFIVFTFRFESVPYDLRFDPALGTVNGSTDVFTKEFSGWDPPSVLTMPADPVREDYEFLGWYLDVSDNATKLDVTEEATISPNSTYYAKWKIKPEKDPANPKLFGLKIEVNNTVDLFVFDPDTYFYKVTLASVETEMKVTPTAENPDAQFKVYLRSDAHPTPAEITQRDGKSAVIPKERFTPDDRYTVDVVSTSPDGENTVTYTVAFSIGKVMHIITDKTGDGQPPVDVAAGGLDEAYPVVPGTDKIPETETPIKTSDYVEVQLRADEAPILDAPDQALIAAKAGEVAGQKIAATLDFSMHLVVRDADKKLISDTAVQPKQKVTIKADISPENRGGSNYKVLRLHNGVVDVLPDLDNDPNTVTFETDRFSPYALVYTPAAVTPPTPPAGGGGDPVATYYTLNFVSNGGTKLPAEKHKENTTVQLKQTTTWAKHDFLGWYSDLKLTQPVTSVKMTGNKTVYAKWNPPSTSIPEILNGDDHYAYIVGYDDGLVHPGANITRAEVTTIVYRLLKDEVRKEYLTTGNRFIDSKAGEWYNTAVSTMAVMGIVKGRGEGIFDPNASITRAELAAIMSRFDSTSYTGADQFPDIAQSWARAEINRAAARGWVIGDDNGTFRPDDYITRAETVTLINRVLAREPAATTDLLSGMKTWQDNMDTSAWYYLAIQEATNSHDFDRKTDGTEKWTKLTPDRDWTALEK